MNGSSPVIVALMRNEYDLASSADLGKELEATYSHPNVILDLSPITYIDSTCLSRLVAMGNHRRENGFGPARLVLPEGHLRRMFSVVQFDKIWPLYSTLETALEDALSEAEDGPKDRATANSERGQ
jgi:anti-anti-sigma regulatory factor